MVGVPPPIDHRCMEYCYMTEVSHIAECMGILLYVRLMGCNGVACIYGQLMGRCNGVTWIYDRLTPLPIDHRSMLHCYTFPLPIDHRSMLHCYTSPAN